MNDAGESFDAATRAVAIRHPREPSAGRAFRWLVPDGWQQGRGAWGGLSMGAMIRATMLTETDPTRRLRTVAIHLSAPALTGVHTITVEPARIGAGVSTWIMTVSDAEGRLIGGGTAITAAPRTGATADDHVHRRASAPAAPDWREVPEVPTPPPFPRFTEHFVFRVIAGAPLRGGPPHTTGWIGYRTPTAWSDASLIALSDAWYPVAMVTMTQPLPVATVHVTASLLVDPARLHPDQPLLHHGLICAAHEGFVSEQRRPWTADGRVVIDSMQTFVVGQPTDPAP